MAFQSYRVVHKIHLGGLDQVLEVDSVVQFNGTTLKTEDGMEIKLSQPSAIAGAIKVGWLVPVSSSETTFTPKSAGIQVHSARSSGEKRQAVNVMTVHDEEQNMGNRKEVRQNSSVTKQASSNPEEGVVVSRIKSPAKAPPVEMGSGDRAALQSLETKTLAVEKVRLNKPTGDVAEAMAGDEIEDILPEAATARPPKRVYANEGVSTSSGGSSVGGQEEGVVIGKVGTRPQAVPPQRAPVQILEDEEEESLLPEDFAFRVKALRRWAQTGKTWNGQPVSLRDLSLMANTVLDALEAAHSVPKIPAPKAQEVVGVSTEDFAWDVTSHWKTRKASLQKYASNPEALRRIYSLDNSGGVKKAIEEMMEDLGESLT